MEEIKIIKDTDCRYAASVTGLIYSFYDNRGRLYDEPRVLTQFKRNGYSAVNLYVGGQIKQRYVHRLIASTFIPNPDNLPEVNHKNEVKTDNRVENLEWISTKDNINYGTHNERMAASVSKAVVQLSDRGDIINTFPSIKAAADFFCCHPSWISHQLNGVTKNRYNLRFA